MQTAIATGDYRYKAASNQMLFGQQQINMVLAAINCSVTWVSRHSAPQNTFQATLFLLCRCSMCPFAPFKAPVPPDSPSCVHFMFNLLIEKGHISIATAAGRPGSFRGMNCICILLRACMTMGQLHILQVVFVPVVLACYASLVSHSWMPKTVFMPSSQPGELPAQLEVLVASLFTISSWRGIYAGFRTYI